MDEVLSAKTLVDRAHDIVSVPRIYQRLRSIVDDVRTSNRDVGQLISEDTGLTARLLRIANSSFYGAPSRIDTITRAVTVIGTRQVTDIVLATTVLDMFDGIPDEQENMGSFWQHSIRCAVMARTFATYRREANIERFFVAGLLHDVGRLLMLTQLGREYWDIIKLAREHNLAIDVAERKVLGFDHCEVGGLLLKRWELPQHMIDAVRYHRQPKKNGYTCIDVAILHVANVVASAMQVTEGQACVIPRLDEKAWTMLGLPVSILSPAVTQMKRQFQDALQLICPDEVEQKYASAD
jgi:HD-like signal output (HDOD) protein